MENKMPAPLWVDDGAGVRLMAGRHVPSARIVFPLPEEGGAAPRYERILLSPRGILWSWTVQRFRPKTPPYTAFDRGEFRPFVLGYVEFPEGIIVEGRIDAPADGHALRIGQTMNTLIVPIATDELGGAIQIHGFGAAQS